VLYQYCLLLLLLLLLENLQGLLLLLLQQHQLLLKQQSGWRARKAGCPEVHWDPLVLDTWLPPTAARARC
jgi:hypothetical protein